MQQPGKKYKFLSFPPILLRRTSISFLDPGQPACRTGRAGMTRREITSPAGSVQAHLV